MKNKNRIRTNNQRTIRRAFPRFVSLTVMSLLGVFVFAGLMATAPDMITTLDRYLDQTASYDIRIVSDMGLLPEDAEAVAGVEGILDAQGGKTLDVILPLDWEPVIRLNTLTGELNRPIVEAGRLPEREDEIAFENYALPRLGLAIGDKLLIEDETVKARELTIVGSVVSPLYYNQVSTSGGRGNTSLGRGTVNYFAYVSPDALDMDYDTVLYARVRGAEALTTSEADYTELVEAAMERLEAISGQRAKIRRQRILDTYLEEIDRAEAEGYDQLAEAYEEAADGLEKLADGERELADAEEEIAGYEEKLREAREELDTYGAELKSARAQLDEAKTLLAGGRDTLASSGQELDRIGQMLKSAGDELAVGQDKLAAYGSQLSAAREQLDAAAKELAEKAALLEAGEAALLEGEQELAEGRAQLDANREAYEQALRDNGLTEEELDKTERQLSTVLELADAGIRGCEYAIWRIDQRLLDLETPSGDQPAEGDSAEDDSTEDDSIEDDPTENAPKASSKEWQRRLLLAEREVLTRELERLVSRRETYETQLLGIGQLKEAKDQLQAGEAEYREAADRLAAARTEYEEGLSLYEAGKAAYETGEADYQAGLLEYQKQEAFYQENLTAWQQGMAQYQAGLQAYEAGKAELSDKEQAYRDGEAAYQTGLQAYEQGLWEYEEGEQEFQSGLLAYEDGKAEYESGVESYKKAIARFRDEAEFTIEIPDFTDSITAMADLEEAFSKARDEVAQKAQDAREELDDLAMPTWYIYDRTNYSTYADYIDDANSIRNLSGIFPIVFFAVAVLVSLISMNRMVEEDRLEIGTLKSMGFGDGMILSKYLVFSLAATCVGGALGAALGLFIIPELIYNIYHLLFDLPSLVLTLQPASTLLGFILTVLCVSGTSVLTVRQVLREKPSELMRPKAPKNGRSILLERIPLIWNHLSFSRKITVRNLFRYKKRVLVTIGGIAGCTALMLTGFGIRDSIVDLPEAQYREVYQFDGTAYVSEVVAEDFTSEPQIQNAYPVQQIKATALNQSISMFIAEDAESLGRIARLYDTRTGQVLTPGPGEILVTEKFATTEGVKVGDILDFVDVDQYSYHLKVAGIVANYINHYVYLTRDTYEDGGHSFSPNLVYFFTGDLSPKEQDTLARELLATGRILNVSYRTDMLESIGKMLGSLNSVVWILLVLAAMLSFVVLYNLANININERRREIATLKVLGFYDREVDAYITREMYILTAVGIVLGLLLGIFISHAVVANVEIAYCRFINHVQAASFVYAAAFSALFTWIVNMITHFNLKKINMIDSLKSVE